MQLIDYNIKFNERQKKRAAEAEKALADSKKETAAATAKIAALETAAAEAADKANIERNALEASVKTLNDKLAALNTEISGLKADCKKSEDDKLSREKEIIVLKGTNH